MFATEPSTGRLSLCLRCQRCLTLQENTIWRVSPTPKGQQRRRISQTSRLSQQAVSAHHDSFDPENSDYDTGPSKTVQRPSSRFGNRRLNLYRRDFLGINSLGRPAEALILRQIRDSVEISLERRYRRTPKQKHMNASALLAQIEAESGVVGSQRVAEHLEHIRSSWASKIPRKRKPTAAEFHELEREIHEGFTRLQLAEYYGQDEEATVASDLFSSYSSNLYTRSEWCPAITDFPDHAAQRLNQIQKVARQSQDTTSETGDVLDPLEESKVTKHFSRETKSTLVNKILRRRWQIQTVDDEERLGQIDIWPRRAYLRLLLNHSEYYPTPVPEIRMA